MKRMQHLSAKGRHPLSYYIPQGNIGLALRLMAQEVFFAKVFDGDNGGHTTTSVPPEWC